MCIRITYRIILIFFNFLTFIYFWETETEHKWGRSKERGRHRIRSRLQALSCQHRAQCGARTHEARDHDLGEVGRSTDGATQVSSRIVFILFFSRAVPQPCSNSPSFVQTINTCTMNQAKADIKSRRGHAVLSLHVSWEQLECMEAYGGAGKLERQRLLINKPIRAWSSKWVSPLKIICYLLDSRD